MEFKRRLKKYQIYIYYKSNTNKYGGGKKAIFMLHRLFSVAGDQREIVEVITASFLNN